MTKTVLEKAIKNFWEKKLIEPGAFSDKQFCQNWRASKFFAIWLRMLIIFSNEDIQLILNSKTVLKKIVQSYLKILKCFFSFWDTLYTINILSSRLLSLATLSKVCKFELITRNYKVYVWVCDVCSMSKQTIKFQFC